MVCCMVEVLLQNTYARDVGDLNRLNEEEEMKRVLISIAVSYTHLRAHET